MTEPNRPDPGFRCYIVRGPQYTPGAQGTEVPAEALQDVYDIAIGSMNFGSGFLSSEEVGHIRQLGVAIGAEHFDYQNDKCFRCGHEYADHRMNYTSDKRECYHRGATGKTRIAEDDLEERVYDDCNCPDYVRAP